MPRRRFTLRLHHSDSLLMLLAVLVATAFCWLVVAFSRGAARPNLAYTIEARGVWLSSEAAEHLLRDTLAPSDATATVVRDAAGVCIGVTPASADAQGLDEAEQLAASIANRLRDADWSETARQQADEIADRLYQIDVRIRDAAARGERSGAASAQAKLAASLEVSRLLRRRSELLASQAELSLAEPAAPEVALRRYPMPRPLVAERLAALTLFGVLVAAAAYRMLAGRRRCSRASGRLAGGASTTVLRPRRGLVLAPAAVADHAPTDHASAEQPRAA